MKRVKPLLILGLILGLALFLRLYRLDSLELFGDELDVGYQAYSVLKTGRDYRGNLLPVYMDSLSESRAPLFLYTAVPFVGLFGLNEWGVRFPAVFWGMLDILFLYLLVKYISRKEGLALVSAFLLATSYWHLHYSRAAFEVTLLLLLILAGTYFFFKGREKPVNYFFSVIAFGLSFYTYNTSNVFVPLWGIGLLLSDGRIFRKIKEIALPAVLLAALVLPLGMKIFNGQAAERFSKINIFSDQKTVDWIINKRSSGGNTLAERVFYNKLTRYSFVFATNYLSPFSPDFLFISGDPNPRQTVPGFGLLPFTFLIPLLVGVFVSLNHFSRQESRLLWLWLAISPIAAALTIGGGTQATRLFLMLPPLVVLTAMGVLALAKVKFGKLLLLVLGVFLVFNLLSYEYELFVHYRQDQFHYWQYGYKEIVQALRGSDCQRVYINNNHDPFLIRYLFWQPVDPGWFQKNFQGDNQRLKINENFEGFSLGQASFGAVTGEDKLASLRKLLQEKDSCAIAFQKDEVMGDWNLQQNPAEGIQVLALVKTPLDNPYLYLLKGTQIQ